MILLIGKNSFLLNNFLKLYPNSIVADYHNFNNYITDKVTMIINFSFSNLHYYSEYNINEDIDLKIANSIIDTQIKYIQLSSRKVYGKYLSIPFNENMTCNPLDYYGENKLIVENKLKSILHNRLFILRIGNVVGEEFNYGRNRFGAYLLHQIIKNNGVVNLTASKSTFKNVISVEYFSTILQSICDSNLLPGIYNVGSSYCTSIGEISEALVMGYGRGAVYSSNPIIEDPFHLDTSLLDNCLDLKYSKKELLNYIHLLGKIASRIS